MKKTFKSPFPALNVPRRNETVCTDTIESDVEAVVGGFKRAQLFVGRSTLVADVYPVKTDKEFVRTIEDNIQERGAMDKLYSDSAKAETSKWVKNILRALFIREGQSEPHHQHQNFSERHFQTIKRAHKRVMNRTGAPAGFWFLCMLYVIFVLNHMAFKSLGWRTPLEKLTGVTPDRSAIVKFQFWEPVYYMRNEAGFPSESSEALGNFVGFAENIGHNLTYKVWDPELCKVLM